MPRLTERPTLAAIGATVAGASIALAVPYLPALAGGSPPVGVCSPAVGHGSRPVGQASKPVGDSSRPGYGFGDENHCHSGPPGKP